MLLTIQSSNEGVPAGHYKAKFDELGEIETSKGKAWRWVFKSEDGLTISGLSDRESPPTTKNKTGRWLSALSDKPLQKGVSVDPTEYVGKRYLCIVTAKENGTTLETFTPLND